MIVLYGTQGSGAAAVEAALEVAGVPYRNVDAASWKPGPGLDELRGVNPLAQIPTVVLPDGGILTESAAILILLGQRYPDSGLLPQAIEKRAQVIRGLVYIAANCYSAIGIIDFPERYCRIPTNRCVNAFARARGRDCTRCGTPSRTCSQRRRF